jgi:hypothetical protein
MYLTSAINMNTFKRLIIFVAALSMVACATPAVVLKSDPETARQASAFEVKADRAKVYFVSGKIVGNIFGMSHSYPSDLYVNSQLVGSKNKEDVMVFELAPGIYNFSWNVRSTDPIDKKTEPRQFEKSLKAGEVVVLRGDWDPSGTALGLLGAMIAPPKTEIRQAERSEISNKSFVLPQSCNVKLCLK